MFFALFIEFNVTNYRHWEGQIILQAFKADAGTLFCSLELNQVTCVCQHRHVINRSSMASKELCASWPGTRIVHQALLSRDKCFPRQQEAKTLPHNACILQASLESEVLCPSTAHQPSALWEGPLVAVFGTSISCINKSFVFVLQVIYVEILSHRYYSIILSNVS